MSLAVVPFRPLTLVLAGILMCGTAWPQATRLEYADKVRLVSCQPSIGKPCFRIKLNIVDAQGSPASVELPAGIDLRNSLEIFLDDQGMHPFYAVWQAGTAQVVRGRVALVLVDVSGSMNLPLASGQTRFEAAKAALRKFLEGFNDNVDSVAIVPFESHGVKTRIDEARFAHTRNEALQEIDALPTPGPKNNTALYSAVVLGLQALQQESSRAVELGSAEILLLVMTDGKNEVYKGDDAGLLDGPTGLAGAEAAVEKSGVQVIGIGFGDPGAVDDVALKAISREQYMARDSQQLEHAFSIARTLLNNRLVATFTSPWDDRASLEGKSLKVKARLSIPGGVQIDSGEQLWSAPQIGVPGFEGKCSTEELKAALPIPASQNWLSMARPVLVFFGLGTLLLVLWFWVPRLVWPEQYVGSFPVASRGRRWADSTSGTSDVKPSAGRAAPPGFHTWKTGAQVPRGPSDKTVRQPPLDTTRSRLQKPPGKN